MSREKLSLSEMWKRAGKNPKKFAEESEIKLINKGYVETKSLGWIKGSDVDWLNKELRNAGYSQTIEDFDGIPAREEIRSVKDKAGKMINERITIVEPFIQKFFDMKRAETENWKALCASEN